VPRVREGTPSRDADHGNPQSAVRQFVNTYSAEFIEKYIRDYVERGLRVWK